VKNGGGVGPRCPATPGFGSVNFLPPSKAAACATVGLMRHVLSGVVCRGGIAQDAVTTFVTLATVTSGIVLATV
jgi:hypothetical protein